MRFPDQGDVSKEVVVRHPCKINSDATNSFRERYWRTLGTNVRSSLEKIRLTVSFQIHHETLDHTMTCKKCTPSHGRTFATEGPQTSRASHQQSPKEKTGEHFINTLLLHEALKHDLHLSILSTHDRSDIACWWWFAGFENLPVRCIKSIMPSLLARDKITYENWHLRPSTVAIRSRILWMVEFTSTTDWHLNKDQRL